jgi:CBS domain-containing membrane protein
VLSDLDGLSLDDVDLNAGPTAFLFFFVPDPPAGATTLIVSLGIVTTPWHLLVIECAVALLTLQTIRINRHAGIDYPCWELREPSQSGDWRPHVKEKSSRCL